MLTIESLQKKYFDLVDFYRKRNNNFLAYRDLYYMKHEAIWQDSDGAAIDAEPDETRVVPPTARNVVEGFRELMLSKAPSISVPAPTAAGEDFKHADHNERTLLAAAYQARVYEVACDAEQHGEMDGWGVLHWVWDKDSPNFPVTVLAPDPMYVYPLPGARPNEWKYVIYAYTRFVGDIKEDWPVGDKRRRGGKLRQAAYDMLSLDGLDDTDEVTYIDYWDDKTHAVAISYEVAERDGSKKLCGEFLQEQTNHNYGRLPWEIFMPNKQACKNDGARMGLSTLHAIYDLVTFQAKLISQKATMLGRYQDPPLIHKSELGPDADPISAQAGTTVTLFPEEDVAYLVHPGPPTQVDTMHAQVSEQIEATALPRALQGLYSGDMSGVAMSLLRNPTLMKVAFKQKQLERALEGVYAGILMLLERKVKKPMYLWGHGESGASVDVMFDPEKVGGYYRNEVRLSASLPTDDANTVNMLAVLVQLGILSARTARDIVQQTMHEITPPSLIDEEKTILAEQAMKSPEFVQALAQKIAEMVNLPYLDPQPENPKGGRGDKEVTMPAGTLPSQMPGMPGGNTQPDPNQMRQEMMIAAPPGVI